jgi:proteic killer suppression protein
MIGSFADRKTEALLRDGNCPAKWRAFKDAALRKLEMLDAATRLADLAAVPGNRLEKLKGARKGQWSIRINDQWRVCFKWPEGADGPEEVEIIDYR